MPAQNFSQPIAPTAPDRPLLRVLSVENDELYIRSQLLPILHEQLDAFYTLEITVEHTVAGGRARLEDAIREVCPYDLILLDYYLPPVPGASEMPDKTLARFCASQPECGHIVAQLTNYSTDRDLVDMWKEFDREDLSTRLIQKSPENVARIAQSVCFREIKLPLASAWLASHLGAVQSVIGRHSVAPGNFDVYSFIERLGQIWPELDEETQERANKLFYIQPGTSPLDQPRAIGFRSFAPGRDHK